MKNPEIKRIKDKWLDMAKLSEKETAMLFSRIEKLEEELQRKAEQEWNDTLGEIILEKVKPIIVTKTIKCPECHHLFEIHIIE